MTDEITKCPICQTSAKEGGSFPRENNIFTEYTCPRCGNYFVASYIVNYLLSELRDYQRNSFDDQKVAKLSHWVRTKHEANIPNEEGRTKTIILYKDLIDSILKRPHPSPAEQADILVLWLGEKAKGYAEHLTLDPAKDLSLIGAETIKGFVWIVHNAIESDLVEGSITNTSMILRLSFKGWEYYQELKKGAVESRKAFMAMQYGDEMLNKIFEDVFKPAVKQTGFELFILQERPKAGLIDDRLRVEIQTSRFLIADLTHENAGAYWEAGYAEGMGKPVIYTCEKKKFEEKKTHFDTNHHLTILWDLDDTETTAEELKASIRATLPAEAKLTDE
jgi:hypothetical protein